MSKFDPNKKVYKAQGGDFSIIDLLRSFADPELEIDGISRISDLHLKVGEPVRYRYDGDLETIEGGEPLTEETMRELIFPLITQSQRQSLIDNPQLDIDSGYSWDEKKINFRLNIFRDRDGMACVMRMLPKHIPEIDEIGFMNAKVWQDITELKQGLVLVTGVTGSGKSTTIASIIDYISCNNKFLCIQKSSKEKY